MPLVLRMALLQRRQLVRSASPSELGYALPVALAVAFVVLLGIGAIASRSNFGFIGQVFQVQNRKARDVAENAIRQFTAVVNREEHRHLLIAGSTDNWNEDRFTNICTSLDANGLVVDADADGNADIAPAYTADIQRFEPSNTFSELVAGDASRTFRVESVEFEDQGKVPYYTAQAGFITEQPPEGGDPITYLNAYRLGNRRALVTMTVIGRVNENGRTSEARIARQLEVVPKCCQRSFGQNLVGGVNWGRDSRVCPTGTNDLRVGIIAGMTGGSITGSNNAKPITNELGSPLSAAACWESGTGTNITLGPTNSLCPTNTVSVGSISFPPVELDYVYPTYANPAGTVTPVPLGGTKCPLSSTTTGYIYYNGTQVVYDFDGACDDTPDGIDNPLPWSGERRLDGELLDSTAEPDPCYEVADRTVGPYHIVNCKIQSMSPQGNTKIYVDTTASAMNFFFAGSGGDPDFDFGVAQGTSAVLRIHRFREAFSDASGNDVDVAPVYTGYECDQAPHDFTITSDCSVASLTTQASIYSSPRSYNAAATFLAAKSNTGPNAPTLDGSPDYYLEWPCPEGAIDCIPDEIRLGSYLELCQDRNWARGNCRTGVRNGKFLNEYYSVRNLLNFYSDEVGTFTLGGNASGLSMNIYAPNASVIMNGGGNSPQYMGQIWTNNITINGDIDIKTFSGAGDTGGIVGGRPLIDFMARSFTQSFGF